MLAYELNLGKWLGDHRLAGITSGQMILNEVVASPVYTRNTFRASTLTTGGVLHLNKRFSIFYNQSSNHGALRFDRRVLPDGRIPPPPEGKGRDMGMMIDLLGDDRFLGRFTYFETSQVNDAAVSPNGPVPCASALGRSQTLAILSAFVSAGLMTQSQADAQSYNWNAATIALQCHLRRPAPAVSPRTAVVAPHAIGGVLSREDRACGQASSRGSWS
jgi:hypothetical protein